MERNEWIAGCSYNKGISNDSKIYPAYSPDKELSMLSNKISKKVEIPK